MSKKGKIPIIELFGPTVQGEGNMCGHQTMFVRSGLCDYKCVMCDSMHAVDPKEVQKNATYMTNAEIAQGILDISDITPWVTLSGGNPALWDFQEAINIWHDRGMKVAVETQGTRWQDWINRCDCITVSPKPPGMGEITHWPILEQFMDKVEKGKNVCLKVVIFNKADMEFARQLWSYYPEFDLYLSLGNSWLPGDDISADDHVRSLLSKYRDLCEQLYKDPILAKAIFLPQLHVLVYSNEMGR